MTKEAQCFDDSLRKKEIFLPGGRERTRQPRVKGRIDLNEFRMVLERLDIRLSPKQIRSFLKTLDRNGDGKIDCEEFLNTLEMQLDRLPPTKTRLSPERRGM